MLEGLLKVGIWSGDVKLRNLELRKEALDQLRLPVNVVEGHLGELTLVIPWSNLRGAPVKVFVEDVFLLASPKEEAEYDEEEEERRRQRIKMEKLESAELLKERSREGLSAEEEKKNQSFTQSLVTKIVDNVQVTVKNIHVRYEDSISAPGHPFALGVTLGEFSAVSTDGKWKAAFLHGQDNTTHKLARLDGLAVYWDTDAELLGSGREAISPGEERPHDEIVAKLKAMIQPAREEDDGDYDDVSSTSSTDSAANHQYILRPVNGQAKIELDKSGDLHVPKHKANLLFEEIGLVLDDDQYRDSLMMIDLFHYFIRHQEYKRNAILGKIKERNRRWTWDYFRERRDNRLRYIELFKKKKQNQQLSPTELDDFNQLEWKLGYEDLRFWRSLARNQLAKENAAALRAPLSHAQQQQQQGWLSWVWGSKPTAEQVDETENTTMTEEQRKELYEVIDWDEKTALAADVDVPRDSIKLQLETSLSTGSFTLKKGSRSKATDLVSLHFDVLKSKVTQRPDSFLADISLGGLRVNDGTTPNTKFPEIVRVEQNPIEREGDIALVGKLKPLEIVWNPNVVVGVVDFFRPPERHMESIVALMETAGATVEGLREQTRVGLEFALEEHKTVNAQLDLQAPLIIVPVSVTSNDSTCLILDAGHISVTSELVDERTMKQIQEKQRQSYTDEDFKRLESVMYDKFHVQLTSTQLLIGPSIEETKAQLESTDHTKMLHVVDRINVGFIVEVSILPKAPNLTKMKVSGHLPALEVAVSDAKYKNLMKIIDVAIPKFGNENRDRPSLDSQTSRPRLKSNASSSYRMGRRGSRRPSTVFPFTMQQSAVIVDDDISQDEDKFEDAQSGTDRTKLHMKQRIFQLKFTVDTLRGSLYRSDPQRKKPDQLLVELVAESFGVEFYNRQYDMVAEVSLGSVTVDDFVENPPAEFKSIVSSGDSEDREQNRSLVNVKFVKVNNQSPEFMSVYEGIETNVDVSISTINLVVTRKTLLTLLDFILVTFTNNDANQNRLPASQNSDDSDVIVIQEPQPENGPIRVKIDLKSIRLILNNDNIRLATLSLNHADVGIHLLGQTMRVSSKLGNLTLVDDVDVGVSEDSSLRQLMTIQGDELADFRYETFNSNNEESYPGYDSSIYLRAGSIKLNFVEEPFRKIVDFLVKFGKMQAIYNAARQAAAEQASQLQQSNSRIKFDVVVLTPIVVFPRALDADADFEGTQRDLVTAYLGEIYAQNKFAPLDDSEDAEMAMKISAGIRNIRLTSDFHYSDGETEELEMIDHVDLGFDITYAEHRPAEGAFGNLQSVPAAFVGDEEDQTDQAEAEVDDGTLQKAKGIASPSSTDSKELVVDQNPELSLHHEAWVKLDLSFAIPSVGLELISAQENQPVGNQDEASLSRFSLDESQVKLRMLSDGSLESELVVRSFTIFDSRPRDNNKYRRIMTSSNPDVQQLMASVTISGGNSRHMIAMVTVDSPRVIFALDYLFALQNFAMIALKNDEPIAIDDEASEMPEESDAESMAVSSRAPTTLSNSTSQLTSRAGTPPAASPTSPTGMGMSFRVNVVDAQVILIANPLSTSSEAIVLGTKQVLLSQQHALTFQVSEAGMFLCRMDRFEDSRLRIIDDFSIQLSMETANPMLTSLSVNVEPLVLRLSLRDILMALQILQKASELSDSMDKDGKAESSSEDKSKQLKQSSIKRRSTGGLGSSTLTGASKPAQTISTAVSRRSQASEGGRRGEAEKRPVRREDLTATVEGIRVILIGEVHELPILDVGINAFSATGADWSSNLKAETAIDLYANVFNFSKSAWEPLIEPWHVGFGVSRSPSQGLSIDVNSNKALDLTITTASIALASKSMAFLSQDEDVLGKPRGVESAYRIRNYTGFDVTVEVPKRADEDQLSAHLTDGQEVPWSFEPWEKMRETLTVDSASNTVELRLEGSGFDPVKSIRLNREGEFLYGLRVQGKSTVHRILVEIKLGGTDNVKYVTFRSPLLVENHTQIPVELGVYDAEKGDLLKIEKISPGESRPAPVGAAYVKSLLVRPDSGFGYSWSSEALNWRDLVKRPVRTMVCKGDNGDPFYFQLFASFDKGHPLTKSYPYMRVKLSAPVVLENLLPYDFKYRIYDKNTKKDWTNFLRKGGLSPVHVVELSHLLLMSVDMQDTPFKPSEFAVINSGSTADFRKEEKLVCRDDQGLTLNLRLHYHRTPDSGGAFKVTVYSPYVVLNQTGLELDIRAKGFMQGAKAVAGQFPLVDWSKPQSFDAIGSTTEVVLQSLSNRAREINVGISVKSGEGKYKMTKVVTLTPRFIIKNKLGEEILIREPSSSGSLTLHAGGLHPLQFMQRSKVKQLCLCLPGLDNQWTAPLNISDIGTTHIKIARSGQRQQLIRAEILLEHATVFIHLSKETKHWPFSMRNESDTEFIFYQANPNVDEEEFEDRSGWKPIRYRLPPRSIMPYAWDFPAARFREVVISASGRERHVKLAEIGNQIPMKFATQSGQQKIIDINVAAEGPTQTMVLSNFKQSKSLYRQQSKASSSSRNAGGGFEIKDLNTDVTFKAQLRLSGIGISLINQQLRELAYVTFRGVTLKYSESPLYQTVSLSIKWIQIDNQLYGGIFPIVMYPSVVPKKAQEIEAHPSVHAMVTRVKDDSYGVLYIKYATLLIQQMTVELDEDFVFALMDFSNIPGAAWSQQESEGTLCDEVLGIPEPKQQHSGQDMYFELLNIQPMQLDLSFMRTERVNVESKTSSKNPLMFFLNVMTMAIGNINDAPVRFNALMLENVRVSTPVLIQNISNHYSQEALYQVHKILGSADFLGNPVGLFNNISSGLTDIFYEPYQGLILSDRPEEFGFGIAKGATSFVKKSVYGVSDSFSKFTGSLSKGLAAATLDKQFQDRRRITRARNRPKHALYGVTTGANSFLTSVASGVGGLARKPLEGAEQEGAFGFIKGVGKGVLGLATKPAIGVLDMASNVSEGIRNTTTVFDGSELDRVRLARFVPSDGIIRPYNQREALGQFWLKQVDNGKYFEESYIAHLELPREDMVVMVTYARILMIRSRKLTSEWDVPLRDVQTIAKERTGLSLTLRDGVNGPFIPVGDEDSRRFLYKMVAVAVEEFNRRFRSQ
ncbi:unnamed protein product [Parascedosporium putredinis]|uniref:Vacuolar protein sorting-associated protein n=1 Tax=Parascedosporium putredinis TaxID=1442378 RepID=A0A9P1HBZ4_9PEZI|nr:unnamed protein product [Parascedosporium putredinis]CAI8004215.1 unnamed protein product [Parascedosporium putredinis]